MSNINLNIYHIFRELQHNEGPDHIVSMVILAYDEFEAIETAKNGALNEGPDAWNDATVNLLGIATEDVTKYYTGRGIRKIVCAADYYFV